MLHAPSPSVRTTSCSQTSASRSERNGWLSLLSFGSQPLQVLSRDRCRSRRNGQSVVVRSSQRPLGYKGRMDDEPERVVPEDDPRYRRVDMSAVHTYEARRALCQNMARGEAGMDIAEAALQVAAEDDALVTHSAVRLPIDPFMARIRRLAADCSTHALAQLPPGSGPEDAVQAVESYLFGTLRYRTPPRGSRPDGRWAYLNVVLASRVGVPAALAVIYAQVMQLLLEDGVIDFAVRVAFFEEEGQLPIALPIAGLTRDSLTRDDGTIINTCTSDALLAMLRYLKQAYWPFALLSPPSSPGASALGGPRSMLGDLGDFGGFRGAAAALLEGGEPNAEQQAIAFATSYRLERGIFTASNLAGDIRRAQAASERLAALAGDQLPEERRDLAVLLAHSGQWGAAHAELAAYAESDHAQQAPVQDKVLVDKLLRLVRAYAPSSYSSGGGGPSPEPITLQSMLSRPPPVASVDRKIPLEW